MVLTGSDQPWAKSGIPAAAAPRLMQTASQFPNSTSPTQVVDVCRFRVIDGADEGGRQAVSGMMRPPEPWRGNFL